MTGWLILSAWLVIGWRVGRRQARAAYLAEQASFGNRAEYRRGDLALATGVAFVCVLAGPSVLAFWAARRTVAGAIPEFRQAELQDRIDEQAREIQRLHREIGRPS